MFGVLEAKHLRRLQIDIGHVVDRVVSFAVDAPTVTESSEEVPPKSLLPVLGTKRVMIVEPHERLATSSIVFYDYGPAFVIRAAFAMSFMKKGCRSCQVSYESAELAFSIWQAGKAYPDGCDRLITRFRRSCRDLGAYARPSR
jgi:hypothetical protein